MVWHFISNFVSALLLCIFGLILQFKIFLRNDFGVVFILILFFMQAMTGCAYLLASFLMRSQTATILGFGVVLVGWILQVVVQFGVPFTPEYVDDYDGALTIVFGMMPWTLLSKALGDLGSATAGDLQGLNSSELGSYCKDFSDLSFTEWPEDVCFPDDPGKYVSCNCVVPIDTILWILVLEWIGYTLIAIYVDNVFPQEAGTRRAPWYFLTPGYWSTAWADRHIAARGPRTLTRIDLTNATPHHDDEDVMAAFEAAKARLARIQSGEEGVESQEQAVELFNLRKVFGSFDAVKGSWLGIRKDELFCLLGPNGAGKSTTINLLTGVLKPSAGEAVVYGQLLQSAGGMDRIRSMMGVCPQFDVLWDRLTGSEHMLIYGQIKGVEPSRLASHSDDLLGQVRLLSSANLRTAGYSGGMKRRLSVAIALLGDPSIVYLDEPTTGMDPISRRHVWDIIEASKKVTTPFRGSDVFRESLD